MTSLEIADASTLQLVAYTDLAGVERIRAGFPAASSNVVPAGWETAWQSFHRPVVAGGVWIGPPWESPPAGSLAVVIDPGQAFGTGAHPTTRLCVELLALLAHTERGSLLDVGCGSAVLALAAARLGFGPIVAVDDDPVAVEVAGANAVLNGVALETLLADALVDPLPTADVAVANVLLAPVEAILRRLDGSAVITSGYLAGERPAHEGWEHLETMELDGWSADRFRRADRSPP